MNPHLTCRVSKPVRFKNDLYQDKVFQPRGMARTVYKMLPCKNAFISLLKGGFLQSRVDGGRVSIQNGRSLIQEGRYKAILDRVQGYLALKKTPPPLGPP